MRRCSARSPAASPIDCSPPSADYPARSVATERARELPAPLRPGIDASSLTRTAPKRAEHARVVGLTHVPPTAVDLRHRPEPQSFAALRVDRVPAVLARDERIAAHADPDRLRV